MLSKPSQEKLLKALRYDDAAIAALMADGEHDTDLPELHIFDATGIEELKRNVKRGHEAAFTEIWGKQLNEQHRLGLSVKDAKSPDKVIAALRQKAIDDAGIMPDAQWKESFSLLQENYTAKDHELNTWKQKYEDLVLTEEYRKLLIPNRNDALDDGEWIDRLRRTIEWRTEDGKTIYTNKLTGKDYTLANLSPMPLAEVREKLWEENKGWKKPLPPAPPELRRTHNPALTPGTRTRNEHNHDEVMREVDRKYPRDSRQPGIGKLRQNYYNQLMAG